jgi:hypothetical protein
MGLFMSPNMSSVMGSVPPKRRGVASGLRATFFNVGFTLSFNIVILVLTLFVPYSVITNVISSGSGASVTPISGQDIASFAGGLRNVYLILAAINTTAIVPSLLRGPRIAADSNTGGESVAEIERSHP